MNAKFGNRWRIQTLSEEQLLRGSNAAVTAPIVENG
jgi:hypothetical protein